MSFAALGELAEQLEALRDRDDVAVIVLTGGLDRYFVAHADLEDLARAGRGEPVEGQRTAWRTTPRLIETMPQPVIAAVRGQAWGGGTEIALACALRVASQTASFGLPEIGAAMVPGAGGTQRLARVVGLGRAMDIILSGRKVAADEALAIGLVNAVFPDEGFLEATLDWAQRYAVHYAPALAAAKQAVMGGLDLPLDAGLDLEREMVIPRTADPVSLAFREDLMRRYAETPPEVTVDF
jgi:enoyl-CoA hydratase/carnithine racemase